MPKMTEDMHDPNCSEDIYLARLRAMTDIVAAHLATTRVETAQLSQLVREIYGTISRMDPIWLPETSALRPSFEGSHEDIYPTDPPRAQMMEAYEARSDMGSPTLIPAVPIHQSVHPDYIICLEDGRRLKTLKKHLSATFGMSIEDYRRRWGLPPEYPTVAPNLAASRRGRVRKIDEKRAYRTAECDATDVSTFDDSGRAPTKLRGNTRRHTANLLDKMAAR
ncbi:hypothetical protein CGLAMM_05905 [Acetobacteraceae bacterium EV16G]|uniref:MucR family transcriptional regulator n=2 Tax=Sorlinia euscelidii TaxID=3081148 RepID=A0ABU7U6N9_9PROT